MAPFAEACRVPPAAAAAIIRRPAERLPEAEAMLERSRLPTRAMQSDYRMCLRARADALMSG